MLLFVGGRGENVQNRAVSAINEMLMNVGLRVLDEFFIGEYSLTLIPFVGSFDGDRCISEIGHLGGP